MSMSRQVRRVAPVAIGGVGGSGTRLIAQLLMELGFYLGDDLNGANDTLWFTLLFKRPEILRVAECEFAQSLDIFIARMTGGGACSAHQAALVRRLAASDRPSEHPSDWLRLRADSLLAPQKAYLEACPWGWKEPNTHVVIDRLMRLMPKMKYLHVARNGLDMAYSANQNQLKFWGGHFIGPECETSPYYSLKYWRLIQRRVLDLCIPMGKRFFFLNYDRFCSNPLAALPGLLDFLEIRATPALVQRLARFVQPPASMGRFKHYGLDSFDPEDIAFVKQLGFDVRLD